MSKVTLPYLNLSLANIDGERWKDIPGLEGYFKISNKGRVKRLAYEAVYSNGVIYRERPMIMKPYVHKHRNEFKGDFKSYLSITLTVEGIRYRYTVARLVYNAFVAPMDLHDQETVIFYKDGNSFNLLPSNLRSASLSEKQKRIKELHRSPSPLHKLSRRQILERLQKAREKRMKPVTQYCFSGKKIQSYPSAREAARNTDGNASNILQVAKGNAITAGGYLWRFGSARRIDKLPVRGGRQSPYFKMK
ncbi:MAG: NUMOD4 domain-containing protein [Candidatus Pseudobacter hemicellulosilyticus]|uniref:NUMOD4 domain-containing protein n=1 Tax=Candidatus Pseudobacter hemicellulosilyticus TaxID=3121375 RepID=A0AAJ6BGA8_9BACT|nr:MAG: NUMOD4 domain-containing protein [Pseudobacter sp.]